MNTDNMATDIVKYFIGIPFNSSIFSRVVKLKKQTHLSTSNQKMEDYT